MTETIEADWVGIAAHTRGKVWNVSGSNDTRLGPPKPDIGDFLVVHLTSTGAGTDTHHETKHAAVQRAKELEAIAHAKGYYEQYVVYGYGGRELFRSRLHPEPEPRPWPKFGEDWR